ncbi:fas-binding factor 1 homolog isoform X5 [Strix aluco]|uniref:fas-binding factor 1 homolog isoform X5 n=1 Tax=Strix aluco TaxID=111821 RepID=UPI003DA41D30
MAAAPPSSFGGSVDDLLGDLLGYEDDESPVNSARTSRLARGSSLPASQKSRVAEDFFNGFPVEDVEAAEGSSASGGEPQALLQSLKDLDDLEADLLGASRPGSAPGKTTVKGPGKGESGPVMEKKPLSSFAASRQYRKFDLEDLDDPLSGLLSDEEQDAPKKPSPTVTKSIPEEKQSKEKEPPAAQTPLRTAAPVQRRKEITFEDDGDDLLDALGLGSSPGRDGKQGKKAENREEVRPARAVLDELLGRGSVARTLEEPGLGERREVTQEAKSQKQPEKEEGRRKDFVFGAYEPSVASTAKGRPARRQPLSRFSAEKNSELKAEPLSKAPPTASQSPARGRRNRGAWLGLKDEDFLDLELSSPSKASPAGSSPSPAAAGRPSPARQLPAAEEAATKTDPVEEEDWLSAALRRKKAQAQAKAQEGNAKPSEAPVEGLPPRSPVSRPAASPGAQPQAAAVQDEAASTDSSRRMSARLSLSCGAAVHHSCLCAHAGHQSPGSALRNKPQLTRRRLHRGILPETPAPRAESPGLGLLHERSLGAPTAQPHEDVTGCQAALLRVQARVAELESQVRTLELARAEDRLLLESLRQRHQEDLDLLESTHRSQVKVLEETCRQREQRLQQEKEQLAAQLLGQRQEAEQARAELEQRSALELERLRELQRVSVQELRREHDEQLQRLKQMKDQEVEAVTSATLHSRTLNGVMDRMEKFFSDLRDFLQKMEATQQSTSRELAMGAQTQEKQLKVLQDSLLQQQRDAEEERRRFQAVVAKMEARLDEQTRLLEQERQRALAERSRAKSLQHSLEEEQRAVTQQLSVERVELERAKERAEMKMQVHTLRAREEQLAREKELLDKSWQELKAEREKVNGAALRVRQQEEELKSVTELSSQKYEEGQRALREAIRVDSQHPSRLQALQQQLEQLRQQEERLHQDRLSMAQQRSQLQQLRQELPNSPTMLRIAGRDSSVPASGFSSTLRFPPPIGSPGGIQELLARASSAELSATLAMMKFRALQDHYYLDNEQLFLESLKKAPYNVASLPG